VEIRASLGEHLAATSIPKRLILLDREVLQHRGDFERILVHEVFHFAWLRLSNEERWSWERLLQSERATGELGWSAEWRKRELTSADRAGRSRKWRLYACESFCDSAAWLYSGIGRHDEFTLPARARNQRRRWFEATFPATGAIPI
jgi:hypothetical protein